MSSRNGRDLYPGMVAAGLTLALQLSAVMLYSSQSIYQGRHLVTEPEPVDWRFPLFVLICVVFTALEAFVLYRVGKGDEVPLLAPVGLALVPWLAGIADVLYEVRLRTGQPMLNFPFHALHDTVSDSSYSRNLQQLGGSVPSTALLLATVCALVIAAVWRAALRPQSARSRPSDRLLEALAVLLLAMVVHPFGDTMGISILTVGMFFFGDEYGFSLSAEDLTLMQRIQALHAGAVKALALLALVMGGWRLRPRARNVKALIFLMPLALGVAGTLWAAKQPLVLMARALEKAHASPPVLAGVRLLPFGKDKPLERVAVLAMPQGLCQPGGSCQPWSMDDEHLAGLLRQSSRKLTGRTMGWLHPPDPTLELAVDARLPVTHLRRLLAVGSRVGLARLDLVATELPEPSAQKTPPGPEAGPAFLVRTAMTLTDWPSVAEVLLPATIEALNSPSLTWWVAELDARPQVPLSLLRGAHGEPVKSWVLDLRAPDQRPAEMVSAPGVLHLLVTEQASTEDVANAVRKAKALGFMVLLSTVPPPPVEELPLPAPARP